MSIQAQINRIIGFRDQSLQAVRNKGVTVPQDATIDDLPTYIGMIPAGSATLIPKTITQNGTYTASDDNADGYSEVVVNVPNSYTATITGSGNPGVYAQYNDIIYRSAASGPFQFSANDVVLLSCRNQGTNDGIYVDGVAVVSGSGTYNYTLPAKDITINIDGGFPSRIDVITSAAIIDPLTVTPTESQQVYNSSSVDGYKPVTVNAIPSEYKNVSGVTATANDVVSGKDIVTSSGVVHGSLIIQHYYTGSSTPSSSLGSNGDVYLQTS